MIECFDIDKLSGEQIQREIANLLAKGYRRHVQEEAKAHSMNCSDLLPKSRGREKASRQGNASRMSTPDLAAGGR